MAETVCERQPTDTDPVNTNIDNTLIRDEIIKFIDEFFEEAEWMTPRNKEMKHNIIDELKLIKTKYSDLSLIALDADDWREGVVLSYTFRDDTFGKFIITIRSKITFTNTY